MKTTKQAKQYAVNFSVLVYPDIKAVLNEIMVLSGVKTFTQATYQALLEYRYQLRREAAKRAPLVDMAAFNAKESSDA